MRDAIDADGEHAGIGEYHLIEIRRGGIAVECRLHVAYEQSADLRQPPEKHLRQLARARRALSELGPPGFALAPVAQAVLHLALDLRRQLGQRLGEMSAEILGAQVAAAEVARDT